VPVHVSGAMHVKVHQYGDPHPATVDLVAYNEPAKVEALHFHVGDDFATLNGSGLEQVRKLEIGGLAFLPAGQGSTTSELRMDLSAGAAKPTLSAGTSSTAHVTLQDGRSIPVPLKVEAARPSVSLISRVRMAGETKADSPFQIKVPSDNDLPVSDTLVFSLKSDQPFQRDAAIEVANTDGSLHAKLSVGNEGGESKPALVLQDPKTLVATLQPLKLFGASAFGPIRLRPVASDGTAGDWIPLVTLVRLPSITGVSCPKPAGQDTSAPTTDSAGSCSLTGSDLYLIDSISAAETDPQPVKVPAGFVGTTVEVPAPTGAAYYLRLRDDPTTVDSLNLPAGPIQAATP
jgi:hypothetical protein